MSGPLIGYYVHHHGSGHRHRATAVASALAARGARTTGLSSSPRPPDWPDWPDRPDRQDGAEQEDWVVLEADDDPAVDDPVAADVTAHGRLHWVPLGHRGLAARTARLAAWFAVARPDVVVSDVSQEVALLARLHGVPVVSVVLPGRRDDPAHALGLGVSAAVVGFWPDAARRCGAGMTPGLPPDVEERLHCLGGLSRHEVDRSPTGPDADPHAGPRTGGRAVVLCGTGGGAEVLREAGRRAAAARPDLDWHLLGPGSWVADPSALVRGAALVLTHAGQNSVAEVAAARVPAVLVPQDRPHEEQRTTGRVLADPRWPAVVVEDPTTVDWTETVDRAAGLDGDRWSAWVDGGAAGRMADLLLATAGARS